MQTQNDKIKRNLYELQCYVYSKESNYLFEGFLTAIYGFMTAVRVKF